MEFTINYNIPDQGWFTPQYVDVHTVNETVNKLVEYKRAISNAYADPENVYFFDGYMAYHKLTYLRESLVGEGNIDGFTTTQQLEGFLLHPDDSKTSIKVNNFDRAMNELFRNCFNFSDSSSQLSIEILTPEFIQDVHKQVAAGLVDSPGIYRERDSGPSNENWTYLQPHRIPECLDSLCKFIRDEIVKEDSGPLLHNNYIVNR